MQLTTILTALAAAATLVVAGPTPHAPRSDFYQTLYASTDCSGDPIGTVDDNPLNGCQLLPQPAYSVSSFGYGCCGAFFWTEPASQWYCQNGIDGDFITANVTCKSYPDGVRQVSALCC
ncbi:hypothetical protein L226DRAFT_540381 [Lentinus tigrinus ALCF2SS1-7]|uniref:Uncharacterized protein n=1 Tax=Lentinus tigrinus ALCF2SS1-6 TaxID=1328759 RepID=A0A5C2S7X4_9APHY|nr:hypothetical protein L227DRAFT_576172 [Lentinus tigrinus ALCF2SS1-6]RPD68740.1 hypothetical protein L226DRAFT_540381 [Lentinus tigrinus ALCF2SS1-7]